MNHPVEWGTSIIYFHLQQRLRYFFAHHQVHIDSFIFYQVRKRYDGHRKSNGFQQ